MGKVAKKTKIVSNPRPALAREGDQKTRWDGMSTQPARKLALVKAQAFTEQGREQRIARSLAALHAPQPTNLPSAKWKEIVEEIDDEA
jgi:hypothetical protein